MNLYHVFVRNGREHATVKKVARSQFCCIAWAFETYGIGSIVCVKPLGPAPAELARPQLRLVA